MIIKHKDTNKKEVRNMKITEYRFDPNFSGSLIEIDGEHGETKSLREDRIYFVLEGSGKFIVDGEEDQVSPNDLVFVPKNTPYNMIGQMKYLLVHSPEFKPKEK